MNDEEQKKLKEILFELIEERKTNSSTVSGEEDRTILKAAELLISMN